MKRIIALDVGDVRIGIASSDMLRIIASPYETYTCKKDDRDFEYIKEVVKKQDADTVVLGLPLNMDGTDSLQTEKVRAFKEKLATYLGEEIKLVFVDERLTSVAAEKILLESDMSRAKRKMTIDKIAASIILDSYLKMI
ncbi:MAG: Holliday junction resolvase RuvX [Bacillota bacterium]